MCSHQLIQGNVVNHTLWWIPVIAAFVGGALAVGGNILIEVYRHWKARKSLALALRGELQAILRVVEIRRYIGHLKETIEDLRAGKTIYLPSLVVKWNYFLVYDSNASSLGTLPPAIAEKIAITYTYAKSYLEDATRPRDPHLTPPMINLVMETLHVLEKAIEEAQAVIMLIEKKYGIQPSSQGNDRTSS